MDNNIFEVNAQFFDAMIEGYALHEMIYNEAGNAIDYRYLFINKAFEKIIGYNFNDVVGKTVKQLLPDLEEYWLNIYSDVLKSGQLKKFENYSRDLNRYYEVQVFSPRENVFATFVNDITKRRKLIDSLRQSELRYKTLYNCAPLSFHNLSKDRKIIDVNENWLETLGYEKHEVIGKDWIDFIHPDFKDEVAATFINFIESGSIKDKELHLVDKRGNTVNIVIDGKVIYENNEPLFTECIFKNVTEEKRKDNFLRQLEEQKKLYDNHLRTIFNSISDSIAIIDLDMRIIRTNKHLTEMTDFSEDELIGKKCYEIIGRTVHCEDCGVAETIETGQVVIKKFFNKELNIWIDLRAYPVFDENGNIVQVIEHFRDITEEVQLMEMLQKSEKKYSMVVEAVKDGIWDWNIKNDTFTFSEKWFQMLGLIPEAKIVTLKDWSSLINKIFQNEFISFFKNDLQNGTSDFFECQIANNSGELFWIEIRGQCIENDLDGKPSRAVGVMVNIQKRKELEIHLRHSEKMEAVGQLAGGIAHDYNNQLAGIVGYADVLFHSIQDNELKECAKNILSCARRSSDLTTKLLAFARQDTSKHLRVNIHDIINEVVNIITFSIDKRIKLIVDFNIAEPFVTGNSSSLQNALLNLVINSRDAINGKGKIHISTEMIIKTFIGDTSKKYLCIRINDTGEGISPDIQKKIFEPFFTTKPEGKGTGMGLAAVQGTIRSHGGHIEVNSEKGCGTEFIIYLPVDGFQDKNEKLVLNDINQNNNYKIMVIDDEFMIRQMLTKILKKLGHEIITSRGGTDALDILCNDDVKVDLIILDMIMPDMSGVEMFEKIISVRPDVKILLTSGLPQENFNISESYNLAGFVQKPYNQKDLNLQISNIMNEDSRNV